MRSDHMYISRIHVTGLPARTFVNSKGNNSHITPVFVYIDSAPFPVEFGIFENITLSRGDYDVPFRLEVYQGRLNVRFDFTKAQACKV